MVILSLRAFYRSCILNLTIQVYHKSGEIQGFYIDRTEFSHVNFEIVIFWLPGRRCVPGEVLYCLQNQSISLQDAKVGYAHNPK